MRRLALTGEDERALYLQREFRFVESAKVLSGLYMKSVQMSRTNDSLLGELPWELCTTQINDVRYTNIIFRTTHLAYGIIGVIAAYLPVNPQQLTSDHFGEVYFFEGFLIPIDCHRCVDLSDHQLTEFVYNLKLISAEYRGLKGVGYAEGAVRSLNYHEDTGDYHIGNRVILDFANSVFEPHYSKTLSANVKRQDNFTSTSQTRVESKLPISLSQTSCTK